MPWETLAAEHVLVSFFLNQIPHPTPTPTQILSLWALFSVFEHLRHCSECLVTISKTECSHNFICIQPFYVASSLKHNMYRICKQEESCPIICTRLSDGFCKQARLESECYLPGCLNVLASGYKHAFSVIYRCEAVSHKAWGWGRRREWAKQQYLIQVWQTFVQRFHMGFFIKSFRLN